jgi:prepilin-type N-terminal cleavage/methylation domain-containing protein
MKIEMPCLNTPPNRASGMTLVEMMVALGVGSLVFMVIAVSFTAANRSFAALGNYVQMDRTSRAALDQMTRDIRKSKNLVSFSPTRLELNYAGTTNLVYAWDAASRNLTQWKTGDAEPTPLLTGCDSLTFSMYTKIPAAGGGYAPTTVASSAKSIGVAWRCSRTIVGSKVTSEDMQQAIIVIRNKPVL